jgi:hypothetical protein
MAGAATVLARNLLKPTSPPVKLLIDLFGRHSPIAIFQQPSATLMRAAAVRAAPDSTPLRRGCQAAER